MATSERRDADVLLLDDGHCFREQALAVCSMAPRQSQSQPIGSVLTTTSSNHTRFEKPWASSVVM